MTRSAARYCRSCGAQAPEAGRFCPSCGTSLNLMTPYPAPGGVRHDSGPFGSETGGGDPSKTGSAESGGVVTPTVAGSVRMGFGIAAGMLLFGGIVALVGLLAVGIANGALVWPFAQAASRFEGSGPADSSPITLEGPTTIEWTASPTNPTACRFEAWLLAQQDAGFALQFANSMVDRELSSGIPDSFSLTRRDDYFVRIMSDCSWVVRIHP